MYMLLNIRSQGVFRLAYEAFRTSTDGYFVAVLSMVHRTKRIIPPLFLNICG